MSASLPPTLDAEQRAWRYWFADGLATIVAGITSLLIAFFLLYEPHRKLTAVSGTVTAAAFGLYLVFLLRNKQIVEWLKARITYPRTGYVQPPYFTEDGTLPVDFMALGIEGADAARAQDSARLHSDRKKRMMLVIGLVLIAVLGTMFVQNRWICAAALWLSARKDQQLSWIVLAGFPFAGFYMTMFLASHVTGPDRIAYFLAGGGVLFVLDGVVSLIRYIRQNPMARVPQA